MKNSVELLGYYGSDITIACSAWTSTSRDLTDEKKKRVPALINKLWSEGHETPFEKGDVHFLVNTDIASHIHMLKHRHSSMNAESARYKELKEDKIYTPEDWSDIKVERTEGLGLQFSTYWEPPEGRHRDPTWMDVLKFYTEEQNRMYHQCLEDLTPTLGRKRAKESARFFKTYNSQIQGDIKFNMRSFANFIKLRRSKHSQLEIREIADKMLNLVYAIEDEPFKYTLEAWEESGVVNDE